MFSISKYLQEEEFQHIANEAEFSISMETDELETMTALAAAEDNNPGEGSNNSGGRPQRHAGQANNRPILGPRRSAMVLNQITEEEGKYLKENSDYT